MSCHEISTWATEMFGSCVLGDKRRPKRLIKIAESIAANPSASFPDQMETWGDLKAVYRLFNADKVTLSAVAKPHWEHTRAQAKGRTLIICDTTDLDFGCNRQWVIRARDLNRHLVTMDDEIVPLSEFSDHMELLGTYDLHLRTRPNQPARIAKIEVSCGRVFMPLPKHKSPWLRSHSPKPIAMNVVRVREVDAPEGVEPIEWILYTSLPVDTFAKVWLVLEYYEARWLVEEFHKALKSGTNVKKRQLKDTPRLEPMVALMSVVAVRLLKLKTLAKTEPDRPARTVVPMLWLQMLKAVRRNLRRVHDLTIYEFYREVAKHGGFLGRKSDGEPG